MARRIEQAFRCAPNMPGLGMVMCQPFRLMRDDVGKARFNDLSDASVQLTVSNRTQVRPLFRGQE